MRREPDDLRIQDEQASCGYAEVGIARRNMELLPVGRAGDKVTEHRLASACLARVNPIPSDLPRPHPSLCSEFEAPHRNQPESTCRHCWILKSIGELPGKLGFQARKRLEACFRQSDRDWRPRRNHRSEARRRSHAGHADENRVMHHLRLRTNFNRSDPGVLAQTGRQRDHGQFDYFA